MRYLHLYVFLHHIILFLITKYFLHVCPTLLRAYLLHVATEFLLVVNLNSKLCAMCVPFCAIHLYTKQMLDRARNIKKNAKGH